MLGMKVCRNKQIKPTAATKAGKKPHTKWKKNLLKDAQPTKSMENVWFYDSVRIIVFRTRIPETVDEVKNTWLYED